MSHIVRNSTTLNLNSESWLCSTLGLVFGCTHIHRCVIFATLLMLANVSLAAERFVLMEICVHWNLMWEGICESRPCCT